MNETKAIAIVGLGAILPDATDVQTFWKNIKSKYYSITDVPSERWNPDFYFDPDPSVADKTYTKIGGWVRNYIFDPFKLGIAIPPRVLAVMDEAQQWGIAATWQALNDYGYPEKSLDTSRVAVILGNAMGGEHHYRTSMRILLPEYVDILASIPDFQSLPSYTRDALINGLTSGIQSRIPAITEDTMPGELANIIAGRIANIFNFSGPNYVTDAACASSLAALHAAVEGLMSYQFDAAITGGVDRNMGPESFVKFCKIGALSPDGSRPYAEGANGFVQGEGTAIFLIKRLFDAERDGDKIYAVIRGIGGSSDGKGKGITAPNPLGQERAIERGWKDAGLLPSTAGLIEGHGTSTRVGDVVEVNSLNNVFSKFDLPSGKISLGSVKSNIGHLKSAAGAAGLLKVALALHDRVLPPSANFDRPNTNIDFSHMPFRINTELQHWEIEKDEVRRAGISSFGFGGANFHVVMEEYLPGVLTKEQLIFPSVKVDGIEQMTDNSIIQPEIIADVNVKKIPEERDSEAVKTYVLSIVSEKTGYPVDMLDLELDLEADLGIDTVKQAELFATMRSHYQIPRRDDLRLSDYNTLAKVIQFMTDGQTTDEISKKEMNGNEGAEKIRIKPEESARQAFQGLLFLGADEVGELINGLSNELENAKQGQLPVKMVPETAQLVKKERMAIDFSNGDELIKRIEKAMQALEMDNPGAWQALTAQGIFRGSERPGKIAFLFPGQGSQYINMLRELVDVEPLVADTFREADEVMEPILGRLLTSFIFVDGEDEKIAEAERALKNTAITQPAMLTADVALLRLITKYGFIPDYVLGHSLGEYAALVASGVLSFEEALEVVSARGREMANLSVEDNGCMAAVSAPLADVEKILSGIEGYVVIANVNSPMQSVIGGETKAVDIAMAQLSMAGLQAAKIPVSHAFHTKIVAPASEPLRQVIARMNIQQPQIPIIANVTGELYPSSREGILDILAAQVASPVQMVKSMQTLYEEGVRIFLEVGPKRVLNALASDNLKDKKDVTILATNHPRKGAISSINEALCGLYAAGVCGVCETPQKDQPVELKSNIDTVNVESIRDFVLNMVSEKTGYPPEMLDEELDLEADLGIDTVKQAELFALIRSHYEIPRREDLRLSDYNTLSKVVDFMVEALDSGQKSRPSEVTQSPEADNVDRMPIIEAQSVVRKPNLCIVDGKLPLTGSVVISGAGLGLPGRKRRVFDDGNIQRILNGEMLIEPIPDAGRKDMLDRRITRLVKSDAGAVMEEIENPEQTIKLAGQRGEFDLEQEFGIPAERVQTYDITTMLAIGAGIEALRDAGIPLVMRYKPTSIGTLLPDRWMLPEALADETGVIFASAFPGVDKLACESRKFYNYQNLNGQLESLQEFQEIVPLDQEELLAAVSNKIRKLEDTISELDYRFDRQLIFGILPMGHSQFAEYIGARGPNTQVNAACASTTHAIGVAEDWIRQGRCRRVVIVAGDDITSEDALPWIGSSFLASGAATTEGDLRLASLPFDRRRNGMIMGMGAAALVVESQDSLNERGMRGICEVLSTQFANSAFHGTRLDIAHVSSVMGELLDQAEQRFGISRSDIAAQTVFVSHETYTPARGGSASAEIHALRNVFGEKASEVIIANTKGFTGHSMGAGIEDVVAVKALEYSEVPPIAHIDEGFESDPELGNLNLSRGGYYPVQYALRLGAGFGSQIAMTLMRKIHGEGERVRREVYNRWVSDISGYEKTELEIYKRTVRVRHDGAPEKPPMKSKWKFGQGPSAWVEDINDEIRSSHSSNLAKSHPVNGVVPEKENDRLSAVLVSKETDLDQDAVTSFVLSVVSEKTGYPVEMLDLNLDLEADLGIDTVKQAELFAAIRSNYNIPRREDLRLSDYNTLAKVIAFMIEAMQAGNVIQESSISSVNTPLNGPTEIETPVIGKISLDVDSDSIKDYVLGVVSEKTGYPVEMLDLNLDLEADLGIDTVKQAELFATIRTHYQIERREDLHLSDYNTLTKVIDFMKTALDSKPESIIENGKSEISTGSPQEKEALTSSTIVEEEIHLKSSMEMSGEKQFSTIIKRRVPIPVLRPTLELCVPTGIKLDDESRVLIVKDERKVWISLARKLRNWKIEVRSVKPESIENMKKQISDFSKDGPITGIYFLPALDNEFSLKETNEEAWQNLMEKTLYALEAVIRTVSGMPYLLCATSLGGLHGYSPTGPDNPLGGGVSGFAKALSWERPESLIKVIDFSKDIPATKISNRLIEETLYDPGVVEVGWEGDVRFGIALIEKDLPKVENLPLENGGVFIVSGGTGGIVAPVIIDLAEVTQGKFYLLGRSKLPEKNDPGLKLLDRDLNVLRRELMQRMTRDGEKATPAQVESKISALKRAADTLKTIEKVEQLGGKAYYLICDVTDRIAVRQAINKVIKAEGRADVLLHAAGQERSRKLESKPTEEFHQIVSVKVDGFFNLFKSLEAKRKLPRAILFFSSVAGRFGNSGQTDYSAANDLLCKLASYMRGQYPKIKTIAIDWGAWSEVGMASRGYIPDLMKRAGIDLISPDEAAPLVRAELQSGTSSEVVVAGSLGLLIRPRHESNGLNVTRADAALREGNPIHAMFSHLTGLDLHTGITLEADLDPNTQPFLRDHSLNGVPVLPGVIGIEGFSVASKHVASVLAASVAGFDVEWLEDIRFLAPFKFYRNQTRHIIWRALAMRDDNGLVVNVSLESELMLHGKKIENVLHFTGKVHLLPVKGEAKDITTQPPQWDGSATVKAEDIYRVYFHGPSFQVLDGAQRSGDVVLGKLRPNLPPLTNDGQALVSVPMLVELCFQTAGIWEAGAKGYLSLPSSIQKMTLFRHKVNGVPIYAEVKPVQDNGELHFDARVVDAKGRLYLELKDYRTVPLPYEVEKNLIDPFKILIK